MCLGLTVVRTIILSVISNTEMILGTGLTHALDVLKRPRATQAILRFVLACLIKRPAVRGTENPRSISAVAINGTFITLLVIFGIIPAINTQTVRNRRRARLRHLPIVGAIIRTVVEAIVIRTTQRTCETGSGLIYPMVTMQAIAIKHVCPTFIVVDTMLRTRGKNAIWTIMIPRTDLTSRSCSRVKSSIASAIQKSA